jgi:branched-chain amino acid transport system substrate-binding protein
MRAWSRLLLLAPAAAGLLWAQAGTCACGANPPGLPKNRELRPYALTPEDMEPYNNFAKPYFRFYETLVEYNGAARDLPTLKPEDVSEVRIGFLGPIENHPDAALGRLMLDGAMLAIEEANDRGGYCGKPFKLMVHNDQATWGASSNEVVKMAYDDKVWGMLGSISGDSTHIGLRVTLKTEVPIVNSAATDPTIPETIIPWYLTTIQDDRVQSYTLARRIFTDLGLERAALLRINDRYGRFGVLKFKDAARRLGHPVVIEQKFMPGDTDFRRQLRIIDDSRAGAIVVWADQPAAAGILKQMKELGLKQRVFGSYRTIGDAMLRAAGAAAEGMEAVYPFDPARDDPAWTGFTARFEKRFSTRPEAFASLAYDTMNILLGAVCRAGLNRGRIRDALAGLERYKGVTGEMVFDPNSKNIVPMYLASVKDGKIAYRRYSMQKPYAKVGEGGVSFAGPAPAGAPSGPLRIAVFGPDAAKLVASPAAARALAPYNGRYALSPVESEAPWGKASDQLVKLIYDEHAVGIVAAGRNPSHLAEQLAVKAFVPLVAISSDTSFTNVNIPWIFRLPAGAPFEEALALLADASEKAGGNRAQIRAALASSGHFDAKGDAR